MYKENLFYIKTKTDHRYKPISRKVTLIHNNAENGRGQKKNVTGKTVQINYAI